MPRILQIKEFSGSGTTPSYFLPLINLAILGQLYLTVQDTNQEHPIRVFFQISQIFWPIGHIGCINCEIFQGTLGRTIRSNFVTLYPQSEILHHSDIFSANLRYHILQDFLLEIGMQRVWNLVIIRPQSVQCVLSGFIS